MKAFCLVAAFLVSGCAAVGPNFGAPTASLDPAFVGGTRVSDGNVSDSAWWRQYKDPLLTSYIERGLGQSLDVQSAQERIREAEATLNETGVNQALSGEANAAFERRGGTIERTVYAWDNSLSASVVLDLFGGIRRGREGAEAGVAAADADLRETRLEWLASMIQAYANARYYQQAVALTQASIKSRSDTLSITQHQFSAGDATSYEVAEAQATVQTAEADLPQYRALFKANVFAIANLLNEPAEPIIAGMQRPGHQLRVPRTGAVGTPADLLRNRPDVRYDEELLHASVAAIGVAEAAMLPSVSLSGSVGTVAGINTWAFGPQLTLPLLDQGLLAAERDVKISLAKQAELTWRTAVSNAVTGVQAAMSNLKEDITRSASLEKAAASYRTALNLEQQNYKNGAITLLDLIVVDLDATSSQISAASAANDAAQEWATLRIAAGAGAAAPDTKPIPEATLTAVEK